MEEKRLFTLEIEGEETEFSVRVPTNKEISLSDEEYSRVFSQAISKGIAPEATIARKARDAGLWTEEDDVRVIEQQNKVLDLEGVLEDAKTKKEKESIADNLRRERDILYSFRKERGTYFDHSAEAKASEAQRSSIVSQVTTYEKTGVPVWSSLSEYEGEKNQDLVFKATYEYLTFSNGVSSDFIDELPENNIEEEKKEEEKEKPVAKKKATVKKKAKVSKAVETAAKKLLTKK